MIKTTRVYPVPGRVIRQPETGEMVPAEGLDVPRSGYWLRRLLDGDLTEEAPATGGKKTATGGKEFAEANSVTPPNAKNSKGHNA